ncbi:MAG: aldo/keto reductase [Chloroflexi bacterium]|nr:aldo/keto reductase [Chloroflexota bacterium]
MQYRKLGNSGLMVSEIGLGGNNFGWWADDQTSLDVIDHALNLGVNFIDTADAYDKGRSEEIIGKAIKGRRAPVIVATKFGYPTGEGPNDRGCSRHHIMEAIDASLRRLQTDYIDHYQMHMPDPATSIEETLRALDDLVRSGKVRYVGCCNAAAWQLCDAVWTSKVSHLPSFVTLQTRYNLLERQIEAEIVPCCQAYGVGVIPWAPLAGGFLTGKYRRGESAPPDARFSKTGPTRIYLHILSEANWSQLDRLESFAAQRGHTVSELAIAWLLSKPFVSTVIVGATKTEQVSANVGAGEWRLSPEEMAQLDAILA